MAMPEIITRISSTLTYGEFVTVVSIVFTGLGFTVKQMWSIAVKKGLIAKLFPAKDEANAALEGKIDKLVLTELPKLHESIDKVTDALNEIKGETTRHSSLLKEHSFEVTHFKRDIEVLTAMIERELANIKSESKEHHDVDTANHHDILLQIHTLNKQLILQIERINEISKESLPELKLFQRDLGRDLRELQTNLALVERSLHTMQIVNTASINLR